MIDTEILRALDGYAAETSDVAAVGCDDVCREAAALIRRLQSERDELFRRLTQTERESIADRDARAALAFLTADSGPVDLRERRQLGWDVP